MKTLLIQKDGGHTDTDWWNGRLQRRWKKWLKRFQQSISAPVQATEADNKSLRNKWKKKKKNYLLEWLGTPPVFPPAAASQLDREESEC